MKICNSKVLADDAARKGYAVPALNTNGATYDITRAIIEAAEELQSPLIIQCYEPNLEYRGYDFFTYLTRYLASDCTIPIAMQLDHGKSLESIMRAVKAGFTGVMIDYAGCPLEENIDGTNLVINLVRPLGISVEAEVGNIIKSSEAEGKKAPLTSPDEVKQFVENVDVDLLAVGIGTTHGIFKEQTGINVDHITEIRKVTDVPLVLHGTSGVSLETISKCVEKGMSKINFGEGLRMNYIQYFNEYSNSLNHEFHAWRIMQACKDHLKKDIKDIIRALGSDGRAQEIKI
ncbi:MAG: class II fructose-bisphosphate aldolase family protein [Firmicutes bacterium]|nr:class II fructose-bisphosphate aldolase family protein [Bacillota bacterium]